MLINKNAKFSVILQIFVYGLTCPSLTSNDVKEDITSRLLQLFNLHYECYETTSISALYLVKILA